MGSEVPTVRLSSHPAPRAVWVVPAVQAIVRRNFLLVGAIHGSTILSIAEERHTQIVRLRIALAGRPGEILWQIARREQGNRSNGAEAIWRAAIEAEQEAWAIVLHPVQEVLEREA